ncbi:hypothetical protein EDD37DRAFT_606741 [Exophiala viscosa]|uniref:uncharacterized protein n=1 Tax=Exophiala viscosa TaxID=2486360 RepID=UPI00219FFC42|nr:hypothetical protein EDD37DRAFT_606741 [Exophiala viscosa]
MGVFDTVKAVTDQYPFDISLNDSIQHLRHALALHESQSFMCPEYIWPEASHAGNESGKRSIVQAWFVGAHLDVGGSADNAGLSLYPLQWMLLESLANGLVLEFTGNFQGRASVDNPLEVVFPPTSDSGRNGAIHTYATKNDINVKMQDLRKVHHLERYGTRYSIKVNRKGKGPLSSFITSARQSFDSDGNLHGQGSIIHPSVYYLMDEWPLVSFSSKEIDLQYKLEAVRLDMLGEDGECWNQGFWNDGTTAAMEDLPPLRILVCGNTGVGKSTLISRVFGAGNEVTGVSPRERGKHNIKDPITFPSRPDLIVHDSCGFEAGSDEEMNVVEDFLQENSSATDLAQRIHTVWFCLEVSDSRPKQSSTLKLFQLVAKYVKEVPLVVVATKKDQLFDRKYSQRRMTLRRQGLPLNDEEIEAYAQKELEEHVRLIETEMQEVPDGFLDACLAVAYDNDESINLLTKVMAQCCSSERIRLMYVRSQTKRIDLKIELAIDEVMGQYRKILKRVMATSFVAFGPSQSRSAVGMAVCRMVINCFGLTMVDSEIAFRIFLDNVWDDRGHSGTVAFADAISTLGLVMTVDPAGTPGISKHGFCELRARCPGYDPPVAYAWL